MLIAPEVPLSRERCTEWDANHFIVGARTVNPHFVHPPAPGSAGGIWFETAIEGIVLHDEKGALNGCLRCLREEIVTGSVTRAFSHGHPYWARKPS